MIFGTLNKEWSNFKKIRFYIFGYSYPKLCYKHQLKSMQGFAWYSNKFVVKIF